MDVPRTVSVRLDTTHNRIMHSILECHTENARQNPNGIESNSNDDNEFNTYHTIIKWAQMNSSKFFFEHIIYNVCKWKWYV